MKKTCQDHNFKRSVWFNNILDFLLGTCRANCWSFLFKVCRHRKGNCPLGSELYNQLLVDAFLIQIWFETLEVKSCTITILFSCRGQESQPSICRIYIFQQTRRPFKLLHLQQHPLHFQRGLFLVCHIIFLVLKIMCLYTVAFMVGLGGIQNTSQATVFFFFF